MYITKTAGLGLLLGLALLGNAPGVRADDDDHEEREHDERDHDDDDREEDEREHEDDDRDEDERDGHCSAGSSSSSVAAAKRKGRHAKADHDVRVRLRVKGRKSDDLRVRLTVRNRGRSDEQAVLVNLFADGDPDPIWEQVVDLDSGRRRRFKFSLPRPVGAGALTAFARAAGDERPENDDDTVAIGDGMTATDAAAGGTIYRNLCATCHGDDGRGGTSCENVAGESWQEIFEALREGDDGMPRFPTLTAVDARAIAAFLRNPTVPPAPPAPPSPPDPPSPPAPPSAAPTYAADVSPILSASCVACHRQGSAAAGVRLDTYATATANPSNWIGSIRAGRMPPGGPLSAAQLQTLDAWLTGGAPK